MILHNELDEPLKRVTYFFCNQFNAEFMLDYFNINVSDDIYSDCLLFDDELCIEDLKLSGIAILPTKINDKIQVLISDKDFYPDIILHELTHTYDFIKFSQEFCENRLDNINRNKYYSTLVNWSEFHARLIEIPYSQIFVNLGNNIPVEDTLNYLKNNISTHYYQEYNKKFIEKKNIAIRDIMWYLGEITLCNLYDNENSYNIPQKIIERYGFIIQLYNVISQCLNFESFVNYVEILHSFSCF